MKKKIAVIVILILLVIVSLFFSTGGIRCDIMLTDYSISDDGNTMTIHVAVASSMGYVRTLKVKQDGNNKYITFYQTFGLNSSIGSKNEFKIKLNSSSKELYFYRGNGRYDLVLQKDGETNEWKRIAR